MNRLAVIIFALACVATTACKKKVYPVASSVQVPNPDNNVMMTATVNGQPWQTDSAYSYADPIPNDSGFYNLTIIATNKTGTIPTTIFFYITNFSGVNTYNIRPPFNSATYYVGSSRNYAPSGQIIITTDANSNLIGTFSFVADSINVTNGSFNVLAPY